MCMLQSIIKILAQIFVQSLYTEKSNLKKFSVKISMYIKYNEIIFSVKYIIERVKLNFKFKSLFIFLYNFIFILSIIKI